MALMARRIQSEAGHVTVLTGVKMQGGKVAGLGALFAIAFSTSPPWGPAL